MGQGAAVALAVLNGISVLLVVSIGLAVIFGLTGVINLAHGEFLTFGALFTVTVVGLGVDLWLAMVLATVAVAVAGMLIERLLIRRLSGRLENTLLATWGLSLILVQTAVLLYGSNPSGIESPLGNVRVGDYSVSVYSLMFDAAAFTILALVYLLYTRTKYGVTARAVRQNPHMAECLGVNRAKVNTITFGIGAGLAGAGGALLAPIAAVVPTMGQAYVGNAFMTVVLGGSGVITGTGAASLALGSVYGLVATALTPLFGTLALLFLAIVLLRFMPTGISGRLGRKL